VPQDRPYTIPSNYDPNLALALVWGKTVEEAKKRGRRLLEEIEIEGKNTQGEPIVTNIPFLKEKLDVILRFVTC
jgi:biotin carboxylase